MDLFIDSDIEAARQRGGEILLPSGRRLLLPESFGFCGGVVRALRLLDQWTRSPSAGRTILLGPIIHNDTVNALFRERGLIILEEAAIDQIFTLLEPDDRVVLPAFGVPIELEERLRQTLPDERILDTTCQYVKRVWAFMENLPGTGWTIVIHGKPNHPETRATLSRARRLAPSVVLAPTVDHAQALCRAVRERSWRHYPSQLRFGLSTSPPGPLAVVDQTTMLHEDTAAIAERLAPCAADAGLSVRLADTVCRATQQRQDAARRLCERGPDIILVVGGFSSSNTAQLYRLADSVTQAYFVDGAEAIGTDAIRHYRPGVGVLQTHDWLSSSWRQMGILAGASCPATDIGDVVRTLKRLDRHTQDG